MDKGGFRTVIRKESYSTLEAVVYCKDCRFGFDTKNNKNPSLPGIVCNAYEGKSELHGYEWFCADGVKKDDA